MDTSNAEGIQVRVHHLNAISTCPAGGAFTDGRTKGLRGKLACHCLLLETGDGLVLVDTGFGTRDVEHPRERLARFFLALLRPELRHELTAIRQVERLGHDPRDVRHVVLTHLDFDHAGGLDDFPWATVHLLEAERRSAEARRTPLDRMRYRPQQWGTRERWRTYRGGEGEPWYGFDCVRHLEGMRDDVLLVPLLGHTDGHAGVAVRASAGWLLLAGDAYFFHGEMDLEEPRCTLGLRFYQRLMEKDRGARLWNQERLRDLKRAHEDEVAILSSHDPVEFERVAGRGLDEPARPQATAPAPSPFRSNGEAPRGVP